jgi:transcriptional regulator with XRE-family HTH domain
MEGAGPEKRIEMGRYIKSAREATGLTKLKASTMLGYRSDGTINAVEQGRTPIPVEKIHAIAALYQLDLNALLDKIQQCEPELYVKYLELEKNFYRGFTSSIMRAGTGLRADFARHHRRFSGGGVDGLHNFYYPNYILSEVMAGSEELNEIEPDLLIPEPWVVDRQFTQGCFHENHW